jgi:hypothetical protein
MGCTGNCFTRWRIHRMPMLVPVTAMVFGCMTMMISITVMVVMRGHLPDSCFMMPVGATVVITVTIMFMAFADVMAVMIFIMTPIIAVMIFGKRNPRQTYSKYKQRSKNLHGHSMEHPAKNDRFR